VSDDTTPGIVDPEATGTEVVDPRAGLRLCLSIPILPDGTVNPSTTVTWAISPDLSRQIAEHGWGRPYVVLAVRNLVEQPWDAVERIQTRCYIVPLARGQQHIVFTRAGTNEVRAMVIEEPDGRAMHLLRKNDVFSESPNRTGGLYWFNRYGEVVCIDQSQAAIECTVSAEHFAPDPSPWKHWLVAQFEGLLFGRTLKDQCHNRQRLIISMFAALFAVFLGVPVRALILGASLLVGRRQTQWSGMKPFNFDHSPWGTGRSYYYADKRGVTRHGFWLWLTIVNPATVLPVWSLAYLVTRSNKWTHWSLAQATLATAAWFGICTLLLWCFLYGAKVQHDRAEAKKLRLQECPDTRHGSSYDQSLRELQGHLAGVTIREDGSLPRPRTTLRMTWWGIKDRACKPFQEEVRRPH